MNNFLFQNDFLVHAVKWDDIFNSSGRFFYRPGPGHEGIGYVRVDYEVIEHIKSSPFMLLERHAFTEHVERLEANMIFPIPTQEINIPPGFNPEFGSDGQPSQALDRVRRRVALRARLEAMQNGTPAGLNDPLYLCIQGQRQAFLEFINAVAHLRDHFYDDLDETWSINYDDLQLSSLTRRALKSVEWGPICYLGNKCGFTFDFFPFSSRYNRFRRVA